jgi:hypothetical protein
VEGRGGRSSGEEWEVYLIGKSLGDWREQRWGRGQAVAVATGRFARMGPAGQFEAVTSPRPARPKPPSSDLAGAPYRIANDVPPPRSLRPLRAPLLRRQVKNPRP